MRIKKTLAALLVTVLLFNLLPAVSSRAAETPVKPNTLIEDFDGYANSAALQAGWEYRNGENINYSVALSTTAESGGAMKLNFSSGAGGSGWGWVNVGMMGDKKLDVPSGMTGISLWVKNPGSAGKVNVQAGGCNKLITIAAGFEGVIRIPFNEMVEKIKTDDGDVYVFLSGKLGGKISGINFGVTPDEGAYPAELYIDNLRFYYRDPLMIEDFDDYKNDAALNAVWTKVNGEQMNYTSALNTVNAKSGKAMRLTVPSGLVSGWLNWDRAAPGGGYVIPPEAAGVEFFVHSAGNPGIVNFQLQSYQKKVMISAGTATVRIPLTEFLLNGTGASIVQDRITFVTFFDLGITPYNGSYPTDFTIDNIRFYEEEPPEPSSYDFDRFEIDDFEYADGTELSEAWNLNESQNLSVSKELDDNFSQSGKSMKLALPSGVLSGKASVGKAPEGGIVIPAFTDGVKLWVKNTGPAASVVVELGDYIKVVPLPAYVDKQVFIRLNEFKNIGGSSFPDSVKNVSSFKISFSPAFGSYPTGLFVDSIRFYSDKAECYKIGILPDILDVGGAPKADTLAQSLKNSGYEAKVIDMAYISGGNLGALSCLVMMNSTFVHESIVYAISQFKNSGDLYLLGGKAFQGTISGTQGSYQTVTLQTDANDLYYTHRNLLDLPFFEGSEIYEMGAVSEIGVISEAAYRYPYEGDVTVFGDFTGLSAVGFPLYGITQYYPLMEARDEYGRDAGWALGTLVRYRDEYFEPGAHITACSINEAYYYDTPQFFTAFEQTVCLMASDTLVARSLDKETASKAMQPDVIQASECRRVVIENGHFVYSDTHEPFNLVGANMLGTGEISNRYAPFSDYGDMDRVFARMSSAGINAVRVYSIQRTQTYVDALIACARKYGVYLMPVIINNRPDYENMNETDIKARAREVANFFKDEPMLLGYDMMNEPSFYEMGRTENASGTRLEVTYNYQQGSLVADFASYVANTPLCFDPNQRQYDSDFFTFPQINGKAPRPTDTLLWARRAGFDRMNSLVETFLGWIRSGIREVDTIHPATVGYYSAQVQFPGNEASMDFTALHIYDNEEANFATLNNVITTYDRMKTAWPDRPISIGEYSYVNSYRRVPFGDGSLVNVDSGSLADFLLNAYSYAKGYDGAFKWQVDDQSYFASLINCGWLTTDDKRLYEGGTGFYFYDGTDDGRAKPIVNSTKALREVMNGNFSKGTFTTFADNTAENSVGTGFVYLADDVFMVGASQMTTPEISFTTTDSKPSVIIGYREGDGYILTASNDTRITIDPTAIGLTAGNISVSGFYAGMDIDNGMLVIDMLEDEKLIVEPDNLVEFNTYVKGSDTSVTNIAENLSISDFQSGLTVKNGVNVSYKVNGSDAIMTDKAGTGVTMTVERNGQVKGEYTLVVKGDLNGDAVVTVSDVVKLKRSMVQVETLDVFQQKAANIYSGDGINSADIAGIKRLILKIPL